jgi:hypothetical protein
LALALLAAAPAAAADPPPVRLLFAGSSSTYWNDLPREVGKAVDGRVAGRPRAAVTPEIVGRSGSDIRVYAEPGFDRYEYGVRKGQSFLDKVRDEKPDLLVLQVVCRFITGADDPVGQGRGHADAVTTYCSAARAAGGEPVFYEMGWGKGEPEAEGRRRIFELAVKNKVTRFAPCATAWARVSAEKPDLALQHPKDLAHPGDAGHFLNLACFYAALTGETPVGKLPRTFPVWPHALGPPGTAEAKRAEADELARFQPDEYQAKLPKWMHRNMAKRLTATLDEDTAAYLESVAWDEWQRVSRRLAAAIAPAK